MFRAALAVPPAGLATVSAVDDLLAASVGWNIRDLVVTLPAEADPARSPALAQLVRNGRVVGVRVHLSAAGAAAEAAARALPLEGIHLAGPADAATVRDLAARLAAARPDLVRSAAVPADPGADAPLAAWPAWAAAGLVDLFVPLAYRTDTRAVAHLCATARAAAPGAPLWVGLQAYAGERTRIRDQVRAARAAGLEGALLSAYDPARRDVIDAFALEAGR